MVVKVILLILQEQVQSSVQVVVVVLEVLLQMALEELAQEMVGVLVLTAQQTEEVEVVVPNQV